MEEVIVIQQPPLQLNNRVHHTQGSKTNPKGSLKANNSEKQQVINIELNALIITTFLLTLARLEITEKGEIYKYTNPKNKLGLICAKLSKA